MNKHKLPETYEVDAETYANVCQYIFNNMPLSMGIGPNYEVLAIPVGNQRRGIMFKGVELFLKGFKGEPTT